MDIKQRYIIGSIFFVITVTGQAQSINSLVKDDHRKSFIEKIKPSQSIDLTSSPKQSLTDDSYIENIMDIRKRAKEGMLDSLSIVKNFDVSPNLAFPKEMILKIEPGTLTKTMLIDGKFKTVPIDYELEQRLDQMSQRHRLQGIMISSGMGGLNLSGFKEKKMSKKAKDILEQVFGMKVED